MVEDTSSHSKNLAWDPCVLVSLSTEFFWCLFLEDGIIEPKTFSIYKCSLNQLFQGVVIIDTHVESVYFILFLISHRVLEALARVEHTCDQFVNPG